MQIPYIAIHPIKWVMLVHTHTCTHTRRKDGLKGERKREGRSEGEEGGDGRGGREREEDIQFHGRQVMSIVSNGLIHVFYIVPGKENLDDVVAVPK